MEKQNINLVTSLPARQSMYLSFRFVKVTFSSLLAFMVIIYALLYVANYFRSVNLMAYTKEQGLLKNEVAKILEASEKTNMNHSALNNIESLKSKIADQERVLNLLDRQENGRFSVYLETLSKKIPDNVWLDQIKIVPEKEFISLTGYALNAALISVFIQQLNDSSVYQPYTFKSVEVADTTENYFRFTLTSKKITVEKNKSAS